MQSPREIARTLVSNGRGILAIDESTKTCNARFEKLGIAQTQAMRRAYRELLLTAPIGEWISGAILYEETLGQATAAGERFVDVMLAQGIIPGIKVDTGTATLAGTHELITQGLDGLRERVEAFRDAGARFTKWRAVFSIAADLPSAAAIRANVEALARYAKIVQEAGLVPIVEPELLADGDHSIERCAQATKAVLHALFDALFAYDVALEGIILKPNMITPGTSGPYADVETVARASVDVLKSAVPASVAGIAFLSGGQDETLATEHLAAMNRLEGRDRPWPLTFSFGRALQNSCLKHWCGSTARKQTAQTLLAGRARANYLAVCSQAASASSWASSAGRASRLSAVVS
jgi:fructose-bisphosphate aldolase, class I